MPSCQASKRHQQVSSKQYWKGLAQVRAPKQSAVHIRTWVLLEQTNILCIMANHILSSECTRMELLALVNCLARWQQTSCSLDDIHNSCTVQVLLFIPLYYRGLFLINFRALRIVPYTCEADLFMIKICLLKWNSFTNSATTSSEKLRLLELKTTKSPRDRTSISQQCPLGSNCTHTDTVDWGTEVTGHNRPSMCRYDVLSHMSVCWTS